MPPFALLAVGVVLKALTCWLQLPGSGDPEDQEQGEEQEQGGDRRTEGTERRRQREKTEGGDGTVRGAVRGGGVEGGEAGEVVAVFCGCFPSLCVSGCSVGLGADRLSVTEFSLVDASVSFAC